MSARIAARSSSQYASHSTAHHVNLTTVSAQQSSSATNEPLLGCGRPQLGNLALTNYTRRRGSCCGRFGLAARAAAILQERPTLQRSTSRSKASELQSPPLAYEIIQGPLVRWSEVAASGRAPPTAVLVHGVLGSRKNMQSFAHQLVQAFPSWQVLLVDLRCHGESARLSRDRRPHTVAAAANDILVLLSQLKLFPQVLIGHSLGGKVVMSMAEQFGLRSTTLPRPVQVWVLDTLPGTVRSGGPDRQDHPADLIACLQRVSLPLPTRAALIDELLGKGFSEGVARWASTNLRPISGDMGDLAWTFDLAGIAELFQSYEESSLWDFLSRPSKGISVHFVRAESSAFRWDGPDEGQIKSLGHAVHLLQHSGHWCHTDNPDGLFQIMSPSFEFGHA